MDIKIKIEEILREIREIEKYIREIKKKSQITKNELEDINNRVFDLYTELNYLQRNYRSTEPISGLKNSFQKQQKDIENTEKKGQEKNKDRTPQNQAGQKIFEDKKKDNPKFKDRFRENIRALTLSKVYQTAKIFKTLLTPARLLILVTVLITFWIAFMGVSIYHGKFGDLPDEQILKNIDQKLATEIYTWDGQLMGRYYFENRNNIHFEHIPDNLIYALIATEDVRFFEHKGIDTRSIFRVIFRTFLQSDKSSGGGSTLTQQLAKNLYPRRRDSHMATMGSKIREMIIAQRLESLYSKQQLLQMYLNTVPFGEFTFGIKNASLLYFNMLPSELSLDQACTLIGMLKGTTYYNPHKNPERAKQRRDVVLSQMERYGYLDTDKAKELMNKPLKTDYNPIGQNNGVAPYLREYLRPILKKWCESHTKPNGETYNLYTDGLKVYTTIDSQLQECAEEAVNKHMPVLQEVLDRQVSIEEIQNYQSIVRDILSGIPAYKGESFWDRESSIYRKKTMEIFTWDGPKMMNMSPVDSVLYYLTILNTGFIAMDTHNNRILAWVGGIDHRFFKYDHVISRRQTGSTFKPFVYANALKNGSDPCDYYSNDSIVFEDFNNWSPFNANRKYGGVYSLQEALVNSINTISVQVMMESGINSTIQLAKDMGIRSDFPKVPSLSLGTVTASVKEMAEAYAGFAKKGKTGVGNVLLRIENSDGKVLENFTFNNNSRQVLDEEISEQVTMMLQEVVKRGTARSLSRNYNFAGNVAGKTGTTQDQADGWFVGYTPNLVFACWVGAEFPIVHFKDISHGQGAATALPIAGYFLNSLYEKNPESKYFGNFNYYLIDKSNYDCRGYIEEENEEQVEGKIHYLRKSPGLTGYWFGTSDFEEIKEEVMLRKINKDWGSEHQGHHDWAIAWKGAIEAPYTGKVKFLAESSGKIILKIDDTLILSGRGENSGTLTMEKGRKYPVLITHAQSREGAYLRLYWQWPGQKKTIIPGKVLFHNKRDQRAVRKEVKGY